METSQAVQTPPRITAEQYCENNGITRRFVLIGGGKGRCQTSPEWECDAWVITFIKDGRETDFNYFTGIGHRRWTDKQWGPSKWPEDYKHKGPPKSWGYINPNCLDYERLSKTMCKPVPPTIGSVFSSVLLDASAMNMMFEDWCQEYGYSEDSIKAKNTYEACRENGLKLAKLLGGTRVLHDAIETVEPD